MLSITLFPSRCLCSPVRCSFEEFICETLLSYTFLPEILFPHLTANSIKSEKRASLSFPVRKAARKTHTQSTALFPVALSAKCGKIHLPFSFWPPEGVLLQRHISPDGTSPKSPVRQSQFPGFQCQDTDKKRPTADSLFHAHPLSRPALT